MKTNYDEIDVEQEVRLAILEKQVTSFKTVGKWVVTILISPIILYALNWGLDHISFTGNMSNACQMIQC